MEAVRKYATFDSQIKTLTKARDSTKASLKALVEKEGYLDDKGHRLLDLPEVANGISALQLQRRVSRNLDPEIAEELLIGSGLWDQCIEHVPVLNEDKVMALHYEGKITEEQIDLMYPTRETYAFVPIKP